MARTVKVVMNVRGVGDLLASPGIVADLAARAAAVKSTMGSLGDVEPGESRGGGTVARRARVRIGYQSSMHPIHAMRHEAKYGTLARALATAGGGA